MSISERIASLAKEKGIKQNTIAEACGVTAATVSMWFKQATDSIPSGHIVPIAKLLGCAPMELLIGQRYLLPQAGDEAQRLIDMFDALSWEGKQIVMATAIQESRRASEALSRARA